MAETEKGVDILYDGECPFCSSYVGMLRLRDAFGTVNLIDARSEHPLAEEARGRFDMDDGMAVRIGDKWYHGAESMNILSLASSRSSMVNRLVAAIKSDERRARRFYPFLRAGRNAVLSLLGRTKIHSQNG